MTKFFIKLSLSLSCKTLKVSINYFLQMVTGDGSLRRARAMRLPG